jgi:hypothetical protein
MGLGFWQWLTLMAVLMAAVLWWELETLRRQLGAQDLKPLKKRMKAFEGPRRTPQHKPDRIPPDARKDDFRFYRDFAGAADYLNDLYADSQFSFENTGTLEASGLGSEGVERRIQIYHGQLPSGDIEISCINYAKADRLPFDVRVRLSLTNARFLEGYTVYNLAHSVSTIVSAPGDDGVRPSPDLNILKTMVDAMWRTGKGSILTPFVEFEFRGQPPDWFLTRRR